jgi:hypothetical protein
VNKELEDAWVEALRSGEYEQGTGCLKSTEGQYCCLGVLGEVLAKTGEARFISRDICSLLEGPVENGAVAGARSAIKLPAELRDKIGLTIYAQEELIRMNDNEHKNFVEIANWIEAYV